jgi:hypothetical protein
VTLEAAAAVALLPAFVAWVAAVDAEPAAALAEPPAAVLLFAAFVAEVAALAA